jgi:hypothetical protein
MECEQATGNQNENIYKAFLYQFSLAIGLFNLMQNKIDRAVATLKVTAEEGNIPAGIALWVLDKKLNSNHLTETGIEDTILNILGTNKCHAAFVHLLPSEPQKNAELWQRILKKLHYAHDVGIYVRAVLNLILENRSAGISDLIQFSEETGRLRVEVIALQLWNRQFEEAKRNFLILSNDQDEDSWGRDYANAIEAYLSYDSTR